MTDLFSALADIVSAAFKLTVELASYLAKFIAYLVTAGRRPRPRWTAAYKDGLRQDDGAAAESSPPRPSGPLQFLGVYAITFAMLLGSLWFAVWGIDFIRYRHVPVVNERGEAVTLTKFALVQDSGIIKFRRTRDGNLRVPRWGVREIRVDDFRYQDQAWPISEAQGPLTLKASSATAKLVTSAKAGSSLARTGYRLWKSSKNGEPAEPAPDTTSKP